MVFWYPWSLNAQQACNFYWVCRSILVGWVTLPGETPCMTVVVLQDGSFEHLQWLCPKDTEVWKLRMLSSCLVFLCCLEMELLAELILFWNQSIKSIVYFAFLTLDKFHETLSINTLFQTRHGLKMIDHPRTHMIKWIHIYYIHGIWLVYIYIYVYTILEPICPLFCLKRRLFLQSTQRSYGFQDIVYFI